MNRLLHVLSLSIVLLFGSSACTPVDRTDVDRGRDPWVFRSVLDWQPRMITLALADSFWVAYHAGSASIYKVWPGGVNFEGPVYNTAHGPQPTAIGDAYLVSPYDEPWSIVTEGDTIRPEVQFRGHRFEDEQVILSYELKPPTGETILIEERPEYVEDQDGSPGLQRVFTTQNVPAEMRVALQMHLHSLQASNSYVMDAAFQAGPVSEMEGPSGRAYTLDGRLLLNSNGRTEFTMWFTEDPAVLVEEAGMSDEDKPEGLVLIESSDCHACHNTEVKTVGPSYRAMAERYDSTAENVSMLAQRIIEGGGGNWTDLVGSAVMTPHPTLATEDAAQMASYILSLGDTSAAEQRAKGPLEGKGESYALMEDASDGPNGLVVNAYRYEGPLGEMPDPGSDVFPVYSGIVPAIHFPAAADFGELDQYFYLHFEGTINIPRTTDYVFRLVSDDGSVLYIDGNEIIDHGGEHGASPMDGEVYLEEGAYSIALDYFQGGGGLSLSLQWLAHGEEEFTVIPPEVFTYEESELRETRPFESSEEEVVVNAGDQEPLAGVHPSFSVETIRPPDFEPMVGGMDFLPDGRLVISTWDPDGKVYVLSNLDADSREDIEVDSIASGLLEPLGLKVVDGEIYVLQKHELTRLIDHDGDGIIDEYRTVSDDWGATPNFHEFAFGLEYKDGYFYAALATAILPGGASAPGQDPDRGKVIKISRKDGSVEFIASGLRTPNGLTFWEDGELFVTDNQGDWLPSSKLIHVVPGEFYGNRSVEPERSAAWDVSPPVVWLPQNEIGNSPTEPAPLSVGPYTNQMVHGDVTHGGLKRVFIEEIEGAYQGAVFRFTQGLEAGINRIEWGPDSSLYVGGVGNPGNWSHYGKNWYGLQRLTYTGDPVFEMLAVRALPTGLEIEFTEPVDTAAARDPAKYEVRQWWYEPTSNYGGPKMDEEALDVTAARVSADGRRVTLDIDGMEEGHVVYVHLVKPFASALGRELWSTEAWYTLNRIPSAATASR